MRPHAGHSQCLRVELIPVGVGSEATDVDSNTHTGVCPKAPPMMLSACVMAINAATLVVECELLRSTCVSVDGEKDDHTSMWIWL